MTQVNAKCIYIVSLSVFTLSLIAYLINFTVTQYPGNNYFPGNTGYVFITLLLMYAGLVILWGKTSHTAVAIKEVLYLFMVFAIIAFASNAVQFTPFKPIDEKLVLIESYFRISMPKIVAWTYSYPYFRFMLELSYATLPYQMSVLPLMVIMARGFQLLREYYFLLLVTVLLGFPIYYFFPTTAPASILSSPFFTEEQIATGLKFNQIHQYIPPTTMEGGLIAFPSFHAIWAWLCLYLIRPWKIAFSILLILNTFLIASCVLLGWHYPIDILASVILVIFSHYLLAKCKKH